MGQPAAKQGDRVMATDTHLTAPNGVPGTFPFLGLIDGQLSTNVNIEGLPAATVNSTATNTPPHVGAFMVPPTNRGTIVGGSATVTINGKPAARNGDTALTCNDPVDLPVGQVMATSAVNIG